ncbi:MAG: hypothetical protein A2070_07900 [Bdellovibrionales bacterium GWC1_52_8]|nr:MAG: hypothetical protein A2Z97_13895 [Bdellovibrionales bacterium GWB1_52_6]OFZ06394.1 MAG: hypothetical protein A2X97_02945 [Bdellovibrionales bacterium GWA1_52_35]OFZ39957.1 MAG: hypothetical protein A2070_07900 [Bdellovibrionales bacterium GWC1_52_8]
MNCPRCKTTLNQKNYEKVMIDYCTGCGGVWLDAGEIQTIVENQGEAFSKAQITATLQAAKAGIPPSEIESVENCPKCSSGMTPMNYNYSSGIVLDVCQQGHGIWFDQGELERVQISFESWNKRSQEMRSSWSELVQQGMHEAHAAETTADLRFRKNLGPVGTAIDALLVWMKSRR